MRAVLGQQVSVRAATTIAGRIALRPSAPESAANGLSRVFPTPAALAEAALEQCGVMPSRAATIRALARAVIERRVVLEAGRNGRAELMALPGVGPWTASYVAMRALGDRDAFPSGDFGPCGGQPASARPGNSRPAPRPGGRRAYVVMLLWQDPA